MLIITIITIITRAQFCLSPPPRVFTHNHDTVGPCFCFRLTRSPRTTTPNPTQARSINVCMCCSQHSEQVRAIRLAALLPLPRRTPEPHLRGAEEEEEMGNCSQGSKPTSGGRRGAAWPRQYRREKTTENNILRAPPRRARARCARPARAQLPLKK